jgi:microcystin degradation protein MlrC
MTHLFMACLGTETNSFSPIPTGMQEFADTMLCHGDGAANGRHPMAEPLRVWRRLAEERQMRRVVPMPRATCWAGSAS